MTVRSASATGIARWAALAAALALLCGCRLGPPDPPLFESGQWEHALEVLKEKIGHPIRALAVEITRDSFSIEAQDPAKPSHIDKWSFEHERAGMGRSLLGDLYINWESTSGPTPVELDLINPRLEENLFDLAEVDFAATPRLARAALERAALEDPGEVVKMRIARRLTLIPAPASGAVEWTIDVRSARESASMTADAKGTIGRMNLDGTLRAKTLDMHEGGKPLAGVVAEIERLWGKEPGLKIFRFATSQVSFLARDLDDPKKDRWYNANLNGVSEPLLQMPIPNSTAPGLPRYERFAVADVDWSQLTKLEAAARERLAMPKAAIYDVELVKLGRDFGSPFVQWQITLEERGEKGSIVFDTSGAVKEVRLPPGRAAAVSYLDPRTIAESVAVVRKTMGEHARLMELDFRNQGLEITAEDPQKPNALGEFTYERGDVRRSIAEPSMALWRNYNEDWFFEAQDVDAALLARLPALEEEAVARLKLPGGKVARITFSKNKVFDPASRELQIIVRVEDEGGKGGSIAYGREGEIRHLTAP